MKKVISRAVLGMVALMVWQAQAWPVIDKLVETGGEPIKVYPDQENNGSYWYIPQTIDPVTWDSRYKPALSYTRGKDLTFIFRGQASVDRPMLERVAKALNTDISKFTPIAYDTSNNVVCQNVYLGNDKVTWLYPGHIGNYLEYVPVSIRTTDGEIADEMYSLITSGGFACTVDVTFKAVSTAYKLQMTADMNQVFHRFEAGAHAEGFWWEVDIHTMIQNLYRDGIITFTKIEDVDAPKTSLDQQVQAVWDDVAKQITAMLFRPALKLPDGALAGRGKPWSLRLDYQESTERAHYQATLDSHNITSKSSQIALRLATQ